MKASRRLLLGIALALVSKLLAGIGFEKVFDSRSKSWTGCRRKRRCLRMSIRKLYPGCPGRKKATSRTMRTRRPSRKANRRGNGNSETVQRWLGPTETRMADPVYAEAVESVGRAAHSKQNGVDPRYYELTVAVVTRESGNREEFINHEEDAVKTLGQELEDVVRLRKDTKGLDPKDAAIIEFGRELFKLPRTQPISSKAFADMEKNFGRRGALSIAAVMCYYDTN